MPSDREATVWLMPARSNFAPRVEHHVGGGRQRAGDVHRLRGIELRDLAGGQHAAIELEVGFAAQHAVAVVAADAEDRRRIGREDRRVAARESGRVDKASVDVQLVLPGGNRFRHLIPGVGVNRIGGEMGTAAREEPAGAAARVDAPHLGRNPGGAVPARAVDNVTVELAADRRAVASAGDLVQAVAAALLAGAVSTQTDIVHVLRSLMWPPLMY